MPAAGISGGGQPDLAPLTARDQSCCLFFPVHRPGAQHALFPVRKYPVSQPSDRRQFLGGLTAAALAAGGLTACGPAGTTRPAAPRKRYGGNLRAGLTGGSAADTIDPHKAVTDLDISRVQTLY
jgi:hypothetical protein